MSGAAVGAINGAGGAAGASAAGGAAPATGIAAPAAGAPAAGAATPSWSDGFPEEARPYVANKGWKDNVSMLDSYRNLEKLAGLPPEKILRLPTEDTPEAWNQIYSKLGKPEKATDYKLPMPEGADKEFVKWAQETYHGANLSAKQAEAISTKWNEHQAATATKLKTDYDQQVETDVAGLKHEWGAAHDQNMGFAKGAKAKFGIDDATLNKLELAMGYKGVMKFLSGIGKGLGEGQFVGDGGSAGNRGGVLTPTQATARINELKMDKAWGAKYISGDVTAKGEMDRLMRMAHPEYFQS